MREFLSRTRFDAKMIQKETKPYRTFTRFSPEAYNHQYENIENGIPSHLVKIGTHFSLITSSTKFSIYTNYMNDDGYVPEIITEVNFSIDDVIRFDLCTDGFGYKSKSGKKVLWVNLYFNKETIIDFFKKNKRLVTDIMNVGVTIEQRQYLYRIGHLNIAQYKKEKPVEVDGESLYSELYDFVQSNLDLFFHKDF